MTGKPAPDEAKRKRSIESIDVAGNAAIGKIILDYPTVRFVDYMTLLKINGGVENSEQIFLCRAEMKLP